MQRGALVGYRSELGDGSLRPMLGATDERERTELASRESKELLLDEHERPLDVFHHPFAHAAARGLAA